MFLDDFLSIGLKGVGFLHAQRARSGRRESDLRRQRRSASGAKNFRFFQCFLSAKNGKWDGFASQSPLYCRAERSAVERLSSLAKIDHRHAVALPNQVHRSRRRGSILDLRWGGHFAIANCRSSRGASRVGRRRREGAPPGPDSHVHGRLAGARGHYRRLVGTVGFRTPARGIARWFRASTAVARRRVGETRGAAGDEQQQIAQYAATIGRCTP